MITSVPDDSTSTLTVTSDGQVTGSGGFSTNYIEAPSAGIGANFEARLTQTGGDPILGDSVCLFGYLYHQI